MVRDNNAMISVLFSKSFFSQSMGQFGTFYQYLNQVRQSITYETGDTCANLFSFRDRHIMNPRLKIENPEGKISTFKPPLSMPYSEMVTYHIKAVHYIHENDFSQCFSKLVFHHYHDTNLMLMNFGLSTDCNFPSYFLGVEIFHSLEC